MAIRITFETVDVQGAESLTPIKILTYDSKGSGITAAGKQALLDLLEKVAYIDEDGQDYLDALEAALFPPANLASITAVYTQTSSVFAGDDLDDLKDDLVVTAHYDDGSSEVVTTYTLSGELSDNPSIITVSYGGKTTTFSVALTVVSSISAVYTQSGTVYDTDTLDSLKADLAVTATYTDQSTATVASTDYTLSGTLTAGTSTITVTYGDKTDTFSVTVTQYWDYQWDYTMGKLEEQDGWSADQSGTYTSEIISDGQKFTAASSSYIQPFISSSGALSALRTFSSGYGTFEIVAYGYYPAAQQNLRITVAKDSSTRITIMSYSAKWRLYKNSTISSSSNTVLTDATKDTTYTIRIVLKGTTADIYINGAKVASDIEATAAAGTNNSFMLQNAGANGYAVVKSLKIHSGTD